MFVGPREGDEPNNYSSWRFRALFSGTFCTIVYGVSHTSYLFLALAGSGAGRPKVAVASNPTTTYEKQSTLYYFNRRRLSSMLLGNLKRK
jgi:hypothetical protein